MPNTKLETENNPLSSVTTVSLIKSAGAQNLKSWKSKKSKNLLNYNFFHNIIQALEH